MKFLLFLLLHVSGTLTFVRHGETVANATGHYSSKTIDTFSAKGQAQVDSLTEWLERQPRFDHILVSPSPRVLKTIAPYLRATHQRAIVWPLLYECCTGRRPKDAHATKFSLGGRIAIPKEMTGLFVVGGLGDKLPVASDYDSGLAQVASADADFSAQRLTGRVLIVGHSGMGGHFLHDLYGKWIKLDNAKPVEFNLP